MRICLKGGRSVRANVSMEYDATIVLGQRLISAHPIRLASLATNHMMSVVPFRLKEHRSVTSICRHEVCASSHMSPLTFI